MRQGGTGAFVLLFVVFASSAAHAWHPEIGWGYYLFGPLTWIVSIGVVVALVFLANRWLGGSADRAAIPPGRTPLEILQERFARGKIDTKEFEERRGLLSE